MKLNIKSIRCIFIIILILILILTVFLFIFMFNKINTNEHTFSFYNEEERNALNENLYAAINDYDHTTDFPYIFSYRYASGEDKPSFIIAVSKDRQMYILDGRQPMYLKNHGETAGKLMPLWAGTRKLSRSEFKYIKELGRNAYKEYVDSGLQTFLEEHPQDWGRESELLYGEYSFVYDPSILTYYGDELERSFELPNIRDLNDYMGHLVMDFPSE